MAAFIWGDNGAQLTPEQITAQRKVAQAMLEKGGDYSPVQSPWQGVARVSQALFGGMMGHDANEAALKNQASDSAMIASLLNGGTSVPAPTPVAATADASVASGDVSGSKGDFVSSIMPAATEASKATGLDPRLIVAQAALESGYGQHAPGNNLFGIKSHGQPGGNVLPTTEVVNGQPVKTTDSFRAYASPQDSVAGYADFINSNPRYGAVKSAQGLDAQIAAMGQSGYATDPNYGAKIRQIAMSLPTAAPQVSANGLDYPNTFSPSDMPDMPKSTLPQTNDGLKYPNTFDPSEIPANDRPTGPARPGVAAIPPYPQQGAAPPSQAVSAQAAPAVAVARSAAATGAAAQPKVNPALIGALTSPYSSPATKAVAQILLKQQMATPEYIPIGDNAILNKKTGQVTPVDVNKKSNEIRDYETYEAQTKSNGQQPIPFFDYQKQLKEAGKPVTNINQQQESEYEKATGKQMADANMEIIKSAGAARGKISTLNRLGTLLTDPNIYVGKGGESVLELKRIGKAIGVDVGDVGPAEAAKSISNQFALELRNPSGGAGMPGAMSDKDREFLQSMVPGLGQNSQGNALIIDYMKRVAQRSVDVERLREQYVRKNGRLNEGFYTELADYSDAHPLFTDADMKAAAVAPAPVGGPSLDDLLRKYGGPK